MLEQAVGIPDGLKVDGMPAVVDMHDPVEVMSIPRLRLHPSPAGAQHYEVLGMRDAIAARTEASWVPARIRKCAEGKSWEEEARDPKPDAPVHPSVDERFAAGSVIECDGLKPYKPDVLARHDRFRHYHEEAAPVGDGGRGTSTLTGRGRGAAGLTGSRSGTRMGDVRGSQDGPRMRP